MKITLPPGAKPGDVLTIEKDDNDDDQITFQVPKGAKPGDELSIGIGNGARMKYTLPEGVKEGDTITLDTHEETAG